MVWGSVAGNGGGGCNGCSQFANWKMTLFGGKSRIFNDHLQMSHFIPC